MGMGIGRGCAGQGLLRWEEFNLESTWRTLQRQILQSGGFLVFVTAVNLLLLNLKAETKITTKNRASRPQARTPPPPVGGRGGWGGESGPAPGTDSAPEAPRVAMAALPPHLLTKPAPGAGPLAAAGGADPAGSAPPPQCPPCRPRAAAGEVLRPAWAACDACGKWRRVTEREAERAGGGGRWCVLSPPAPRLSSWAGPHPTPWPGAGG